MFNEVWMQDIESLPFRNPVDPVQLEIPVSLLVCVLCVMFTECLFAP